METVRKLASLVGLMAVITELSEPGALILVEE
jgi:hypothetical protein